MSSKNLPRKTDKGYVIKVDARRYGLNLEQARDLVKHRTEIPVVGVHTKGNPVGLVVSYEFFNGLHSVDRIVKKAREVRQQIEDLLEKTLWAIRRLIARIPKKYESGLAIDLSPLKVSDSLARNIKNCIHHAPGVRRADLHEQTVAVELSTNARISSSEIEACIAKRIAGHCPTLVLAAL